MQALQSPSSMSKAAGGGKAAGGQHSFTLHRLTLFPFLPAVRSPFLTTPSSCLTSATSHLTPSPLLSSPSFPLTSPHLYLLSSPLTPGTQGGALLQYFGAASSTASDLQRIFLKKAASFFAKYVIVCRVCFFHVLYSSLCLLCTVYCIRHHIFNNMFCISFLAITNGILSCYVRTGSLLCTCLAW
jgi:hypothetical protein